MNEFRSVVFKKKTICDIKVAQNDTIKYQKTPTYKSKKTSPKYKKIKLRGQLIYENRKYSIQLQVKNIVGAFASIFYQWYNA